MSYILDALRKADAERERGAASDLLGAPHAEPAASAPPPARTVPIWLWLALGALIPLGALLAWRMLMPDEPGTQAVVASASVPPSARTPAAQPMPASSPPAATDEAARPVEAAPADDAASAALANDEAAPVTAPPPKPTRKTPPAKPAAVATAKPPARAQAKPDAASAPPRALAELPEDLRRQVPAMTIGGSVYSPQPADRMLIVNGQVTREGATLAPGLRLESIGRQSAIFSIRGQRFEMKL